MSQEIDRNHEIQYYSEVCSRCKHLKLQPASAFTEENTTGHCRAFPDGIPEAIWLGWNRHTTHFDGDNGILFESADAQ